MTERARKNKRTMPLCVILRFCVNRRAGGPAILHAGDIYTRLTGVKCKNRAKTLLYYYVLLCTIFFFLSIANRKAERRHIFPGRYRIDYSRTLCRFIH